MSNRPLVLILVLGLVGAGAMAAYLQHDPVEIDATELEAPGRPVAAVDSATALLVVDHAVIARAAERKSWSAFDASYAWLSDLREEFGRTSVVDLSALDDAALAHPQIVVLSRSTERVDPSVAARVRAWVQAGGSLVLETPNRALQEAFAIELGPTTEAARVDSIANAPSAWPTREHAALPPPPSIATLASPDASWQPQLWVDSAACAWSRPLGRGAVLVLGVPLSKWLTELRQGKPQDDFTVRPTRGSDGREQFLQPNDFMRQPDRAEAWLPRADLLVRALLSSLHELHPRPRIGALPAGARGLFLMTHDEEDFGDRSTFMSDESARQGVRSTMFVVGGRLTADGARRMLESGADVQLHWNRGYFRREIRRFGLGPFRPLMRPMNLVEQRDRLAATVGPDAPPIDLNRNHGLLWDEHWSRTFRILEAAGFRFDSTYGVDEELFGWVFDTARAYHPLDDNGLPFTLVELPFPYQDDENVSLPAQRRLLDESETVYHGVLAPIFHTMTMVWNPKAESVRAWLESYERAPEHRHPVWSVSQYVRFREERLASRVVEAPRGETWTYDVDLRGEGLVVEWPAGLRLVEPPLEVAPTVAGFEGVALPRGVHRLHFEGVR